MLNIYTASGQNRRSFHWSKKKQALDFYNSIKDLERTELHYMFYCILPEDIYSLEGDRKQAKYYLDQFLKGVNHEEENRTV